MLVGASEMWDSESPFRPWHEWMIWYQRPFGKEDWCISIHVEYRMCFSYSFSSNPLIFLSTVGRSCGFLFLHNFLFPTPKIKTQDKYIFHSFQDGIFYLLRLLFIWVKSLLVLFLEHFIKTSLVDVSMPWTHILASWKWAVHPFRQITQLPLRSGKFSEIPFPPLHYTFLSRRRRNTITVNEICINYWNIREYRISLTCPRAAMHWKFSFPTPTPSALLPLVFSMKFKIKYTGTFFLMPVIW